jgi:hypothetical protein
MIHREPLCAISPPNAPSSPLANDQASAGLERTRNFLNHRKGIFDDASTVTAVTKSNSSR